MTLARTPGHGDRSGHVLMAPADLVKIALQNRRSEHQHTSHEGLFCWGHEDMSSSVLIAGASS